MDHDAISRVKKLLSLAKDNANQNEMNSSARLAMRIMAKHGITDADLVEADDPVSDNRDDAVVIGTGHRAAAWKWNLAWVVSDSANCKPYQLHEKRGQEIVALKVGFIGRRSDAQLCGYLYQYLLAEMKRFHSERLPSIGSRIQCYIPGAVPVLLDRTGQRQWSRDFYIAAVSALHKRMVDVREEVRRDAHETALVHLSRLGAKVDDVASAMGLTYQDNVPVDVRSQHGFQAGLQAGRSVDLSRDHAAMPAGQAALPPGRTKS